MHGRSHLRPCLVALAACLLVACEPPAPAPFEPDAVEQIPGSKEPPRIHEVYSPCTLPDGLSEGDVPPVDLDDPESVFGDGGLPLFDIRFPPGAWEEACENAKYVADWMKARRHGDAPATITRPVVRVDVFIQGRALYDVGFRFRGQSNLFAMFYDRWTRPRAGALQACKTDRMAKKASYRIVLDEFVPGRRVAGQRAFDFAGREGSDAAYLREVTAQHVAREFGLPAPLVGHARVCRDGEYDGLFTLAEEADFRGLPRRLFPGDSEGGYWEVVAPSSQAWEPEWTDSEGWQVVYDAVKPTSDTDIGRLGLLLDAGDIARAGGVPSGLDELIDVDAWLRNIALDMVIPDYDGMMGNHKNHALYDHPTRGLLPISYDKDIAFVDLGSYQYGLCAGSIWGANPCWSSRTEPPELAGHLLQTQPQEYLARVQELVDGPLDPTTLIPWLHARRDAIRPWVAADRYYQPDGPACDSDPDFCQWYTPGAWEYEALLLEMNIETRLIEVRRQLEGQHDCVQSCMDPPFPWLVDGY